MKTIVYSALCLAIATLTSASAGVLIYRGSYKPFNPSLEETDAPAQKCYVVIGEPAESAYDVVILHYGQRDNVKKVVQEAKRSMYPKEFTALNGKTYTAFTFAEFVDGVIAIRNSAIFMRGANRLITIANAPVTSRTLPKTMNGIIRESIVSAIQGSAYIDASFTVTLDSPSTLAANNAKKTFDTTVADLKGKLNAMGYAND
jgi:hypothetical protein